MTIINDILFKYENLKVKIKDIEENKAFYQMKHNNIIKY